MGRKAAPSRRPAASAAVWVPSLLASHEWSPLTARVSVLTLRFICHSQGLGGLGFYSTPCIHLGCPVRSDFGGVRGTQQWLAWITWRIGGGVAVRFFGRSFEERRKLLLHAVFNVSKDVVLTGTGSDGDKRCETVESLS